LRTRWQESDSLEGVLLRQKIYEKFRKALAKSRGSDGEYLRNRFVAPEMSDQTQ